MVGRRTSGFLWGLVGGVDAGKVLDLAGLGAGIEALGVAADAFLDRGVDEHLDEFAVANQRALGAIA
jgi:hypothetical protein